MVEFSVGRMAGRLFSMHSAILSSGCSCRTAVENKTHDLEAVGLNPAACRASSFDYFLHKWGVFNQVPQVLVM